MTSDTTNTSGEPTASPKRLRWHFIVLGVVLLAVVANIARQWGTHPLTGQAAPPFTAPLLGGGTLDLANHLGKDVVILDFWATWCPPCRKGLPAVAAAAKAFHGQGAVVYAVNLMEPESKVTAYLRDAGLDLPVALDADGVAARLYEVSGIPQTVFIGKDGIIREVHVGLSTNFESMLSARLKKLISEK